MREDEQTWDRQRTDDRGQAAPFRGFGVGYQGGALRSRGSYQAGRLRSGPNPVDEFEFEWGEGYVGGRGYGGTNYDLRHGYLTRGVARSSVEPARRPVRRTSRDRGERPSGRSPRGGYEWGEEYRRLQDEPYGPARYGYGPYFDRLRRRRRPDEVVKAEVEETLFYDTWIDADRIETEVEDGIVTLKGTLRSFDEVRYATDDAWDVDGVVGVRTELRVEDMDARERTGESAGSGGHERASGEDRESPQGSPGAPGQEGPGPGTATGAHTEEQRSKARPEGGA